MMFLFITVLLSLAVNQTYSLKEKSYISHSKNNSYQSESDEILAKESENQKVYEGIKYASDLDLNNHNNKAYNSPNNNFEDTSKNHFLTSEIEDPKYSQKKVKIEVVETKIRNAIENTTSTISSIPQYSLQHSDKNYGARNSTATIVYATSIPNSIPSRTFVNIRPASFLSNQKYSSTVGAENEKVKLVIQNNESIEPIVQHQQSSQQEQQLPKDNNYKERNFFVLKNFFKINNLNSTSPTETLSSVQDSVQQYQSYQQNKNPYKSILHSRIRKNHDDIPDIKSSKWSSEHRMPQFQQPFSTTLTPNSETENSDNEHRHPLQAAHQNKIQNNLRPIHTNYDLQEEMYIPPYDEKFQEPIMHSLLSQQQLRHHKKRILMNQRYPPLTVNDFLLMLQLLVLKEEHLHATSKSQSDFKCQQNQQQYNLNYHSAPKILNSEKLKNLELPPNVREELLFRMLLIALHLHPQTQTEFRLNPPMIRNVIFPDLDDNHNSYLGSQLARTLSIPPEHQNPPHLNFRNSDRSSTVKYPVMSVQILGEIN